MPKETKSKYLYIVIVIILFILSGCSNALSNKEIKPNEVIAKNQESNIQHENEMVGTGIKNANLNVNETVFPEIPKEDDTLLNDDTLKQIEEKFAKNKTKYSVAIDNTIYSEKEIIIVNRNFVVALEGYHTRIDQLLAGQGKKYLVADFSIINYQKDDYNSSLSDFTLMDDADFTYSPESWVGTRGDIEGTMKPKDFRRGEIAFAVPLRGQKFTLLFNTNIESPQKVKFKIELPPLDN